MDANFKNQYIISIYRYHIVGVAILRILNKSSGEEHFGKNFKNIGKFMPINTLFLALK